MANVLVTWEKSHTRLAFQFTPQGDEGVGSIVKAKIWLGR